MNTITSHPLMGQGVLGQAVTGTSQSMFSTQPQRPVWPSHASVRITVEKVDNGYIMRSSKHEGELAKVKICTNMDELRDLFVATLIEHQLEQ